MKILNVGGKMIFDHDLDLLKMEIDRAGDMNELENIHKNNEKKYWWSSIFIGGLFYGINGKIGKMVLTWILSVFTLGIYGIYVIYTSYRDQNEFNSQLEYFILKKSEEFGEKSEDEVLQIGHDKPLELEDTGVIQLPAGSDEYDK